jgi:hypothetical protein
VELWGEPQIIVPCWSLKRMQETLSFSFLHVPTSFFFLNQGNVEVITRIMGILSHFLLSLAFPQMCRKSCMNSWLGRCHRDLPLWDSTRVHWNFHHCIWHLQTKEAPGDPQRFFQHESLDSGHVSWMSMPHQFTNCTEGQSYRHTYELRSSFPMLIV